MQNSETLPPDNIYPYIPVFAIYNGEMGIRITDLLT